MSQPETTTQPLIGAARQETAINVGAPSQGGRSTRAYKVAGITLLACVLIVSQVAIAYFLLSQKNDIKSLEEQSNNLQAEMTRGGSVSVPVKSHIPMNALPALQLDTMDEEALIEEPGKLDLNTNCQLEAAGLKDVQVPGFHPVCDERGLYKVQQCYMGSCWCVNPANGVQIPGTLSNGQARCRVALRTGVQSKMLSLSDVNV